MKIAPAYLCLVLFCCLVEGDARPRLGGLRKVIGFLERKAAELKENLDGTVEFPRELQYTLNVDGEASRDIDLLLNPFMQMPTKNEERRGKYAFYTESKTGESFACKMKRFSGKLECDIAGITKRSNETCYVSSNSKKAECTTSDEFKDGVLLVLDENGNPIDSASFTYSATVPRKGRSIFPKAGAKVIEIGYVVDKAFMSPFYDRNPGNNDAAEEEAELFITLLANEMSVYYRSVKEVSNGQLDLVIYPSAFIFPQKGYDFDWSRTNIINDHELNIDGAILNFSNFANNVKGSYQFDHAMGITGLDLYASSVGNGLLGVAYVNTMCKANARAVSLQENLGYNLGFVASHELGHSLGYIHDVSIACPANRNVMSAGLFNPTEDTKTTYNKFSSCSVNTFINHLRTYPGCINKSSFTDDQFRDSFCQGLLGAEDASLDRQCQTRTGSTTASACVTKVAASSCYRGYTVYCRRSPSESCSTSLTFVWNGTPCGAGDGNVCYRGDCVPRFEICSSDVTEDPGAPSPTSSTSTSTTTKSTPPTKTTTETPCFCCTSSWFWRLLCCVFRGNTACNCC